MKKILVVILTCMMLFALASCGRNNNSNEVSQNNLVGEHNASQTNSKKEVTIKKEMITMNITVGNKTFVAKLENNDTTKALVAQLPLTVDMSELNGNEKYNYLSSNLRVDKSLCPGTINEGDLMLYGNNCLVLFYKTFNTSYNYVKIGHINNTKGLTKALGTGNVQVTFSVSN